MKTRHGDKRPFIRPKVEPGSWIDGFRKGREDQAAYDRNFLEGLLTLSSAKAIHEAIRNRLR